MADRQFIGIEHLAAVVQVAFGRSRRLAAFERLPERGLEWIMALNMVWWGWKITAPDTQWANNAAWEFMLQWMPEELWGWLCILIDGLRLLALW